MREIRKLRSMKDFDSLIHGDLIEAKINDIGKKLVFLKPVFDLRRYVFAGRGDSGFIDFYLISKNNGMIRNGHMITNIKRKVELTFYGSIIPYEQTKQLMEYVGI